MTRRILHVVRPATGGMNRHVLTLARGLAESGFEVGVACPPDSALAEEVRAAGITYHPVAIAASPGANDTAAVRALAAIVRRDGYDIVHCHGFKAGIVGRLAARLAGHTHAALTVHNHVLYRDDGRLKQAAHRVSERLLAPSTDLTITVSESLKRELVEAYGLGEDRIVAVPNGIDLAPFLDAPALRTASRAGLGLPEDVTAVGAICRLAPQKGLRHLIEAVALLRPSPSDAVFLIAGDGPLAEELHAQAAEAGVEGLVRFLGHRRDVPALLAALDVYVAPSLSEGTSLGLIEAMGAGLPIVSTRAGGTPEMVADRRNGLLVEPGDAAALARALREVIASVELRRELGEAGRERALREFSREAMVARTAELYARV